MSKRMRPLEGPKDLRNQLFLLIINFIIQKQFIRKVIPLHMKKWLEAMEDEMKSMSSNDVWDLEEDPKESKTVGFKWVYKTKYDSNGNVEKYKARLVAKEFT
jgi:hypothetical protein